MVIILKTQPTENQNETPAKQQTTQNLSRHVFQHIMKTEESRAQYNHAG